MQRLVVSLALPKSKWKYFPGHTYNIHIINAVFNKCVCLLFFHEEMALQIWIKCKLYISWIKTRATFYPEIFNGSTCPGWPRAVQLVFYNFTSCLTVTAMLFGHQALRANCMTCEHACIYPDRYLWYMGQLRNLVSKCQWITFWQGQYYTRSFLCS